MKKRIVVAVLSLGAVVILLCVYYSGVHGPGPSTKRSGFTDHRFLLLLFPVGKDVPLGRAVITNLSEYKQGLIEVYGDGSVATVPRSAFTAVPPQDYAARVKYLNNELVAWGKETDWSNIEYAFTPSEQGGKVVMTIRDKIGSTHEYTYLVDGLSIRPLQAKTEINTAGNLGR